MEWSRMESSLKRREKWRDREKQDGAAQNGAGWSIREEHKGGAEHK